MHLAYTPTPFVLSVDFVSASSSPAQAWTSLDNSTWSSPVAATTFHAPTIGYMSQATLDFSGAAAGAKAYYKLAAGADSSPVFGLVPEVARPEVFAVYGDFGLSNDACMEDLTASAARGDFDVRFNANNLREPPNTHAPQKHHHPLNQNRVCCMLATGRITSYVRCARARANHPAHAKTTTPPPQKQTRPPPKPYHPLNPHLKGGPGERGGQ